jgi:hypothetical protein
VVDDDDCRPSLREIFQAAHGWAHREKRQQLCESPSHSPKEPPRGRQPW